MRLTIVLSADRIRDIEARADRAHPDEPCCTAAEVLALIRTLREVDTRAALYADQAGRASTLADEWISSRDLSVAAAGRLLARALAGA